MRQKRPPIVAVMGHVDHGKTTLLDYIKKTKLAEREPGGITQSIGAYEIELKGKGKITFIDTPGHQAFKQMRMRGTQAADIALLVIAADDGVKEQTKESLRIIKESKTPFIVVINKIDKDNADINKVQNELAVEGVLLEGRGGNVSWKAVSAKTGEGIDDLLDLILLTAEIEELAYDSEAPAAGYVLESRLDSRRGPLATLVVKDGILRKGDKILAGAAQAKIKYLENSLGQQVDEVQPSAPAQVLGFAEVPKVGVEFHAVSGALNGEVKPIKNQSPVQHRVGEEGEDSEDAQVVKFFLKAGDHGSLEALEEIIKALPLPENYKMKIVSKEVGDITDGDVKIASASSAVIIGFKVKVAKAADNLAKAQSVKIIQSNIIYRLTEEVEQWLANIKEEIKTGTLKVLAVFGKKSDRQIIGGKVTSGEIINNGKFTIVRGEKEIGSGKIINLQKDKKDVNKVEAGSECGLLVQADVDIKVNDEISQRKA